MICPSRARAAILLSLLGLVGLSGEAYAQLCPATGCTFSPSAASRRSDGHLVSLGANVVIGGLTGGIGNNVRGGSFWRGFVVGAGGGAILYGGKRISGGRFRGAGFLGRETSALGTSIVANAAAKRGAFERLVIPIGPTRLYLNRVPEGTSRLKVDLPATVAAFYFGVHPDVGLDLTRSASAGAPVFVARPDALSTATEMVGVIRLPSGTDAHTQAHEQIHVAQTDFTFLAWSEPLEQRLFSKHNATRRFQQYFDLRLDGLLLLGLNAVIPHSSRPWEREAEFLSRPRQSTEVRYPIQYHRSRKIGPR